MRKLRRILSLLAAVTMLTTSSITAMAAVDQTPAHIVAELTGKSVEDVIDERFSTGKTYGALAAEAGKLDEFKEESLKLKEEILQQNVTDGILSQEEADEILAAIKDRQAICDGTGYGSGLGNGYGYGCGGGFGRGQGRGFRNGSCPYYNN